MVGAVSVIWVSPAAALGGSEVTFSTMKLEYTGSNPHLISILHLFSHFFFPRNFLSFYAGPLALPTMSGCRTSSHCLLHLYLHSLGFQKNERI